MKPTSGGAAISFYLLRCSPALTIYHRRRTPGSWARSLLCSIFSLSFSCLHISVLSISIHFQVDSCRWFTGSPIGITKVKSKRLEPSTIEVALELERIAAVLRNSQAIADQSRKQIAEMGKSASPWQRIKEDGYRGFADSDLINAFEKICVASQAIGLLILREGELEGFCRSFSRRNKAEWLASVLQLDLDKTKDWSRLESLRLAC